MPVVFTISLRNLVRQKRRNLLLGTAIAFGAMILILANAFAAGISDVMFNKIMRYVSGHVSVNFTTGGDVYKQIFFDGDRMFDCARKNVAGVTQMTEAIGFFARAIGNGKSDNVILVGVDLTAQTTKEELKETMSNFRMIQGRFEDLGDSAVENPVLIAEEKATYLNVTKGDMLRVRFRNVRGQDQAVRLTVVGIFKPANMFMSSPVFLELRDVKRILGYRPHEIGQLYIYMKDPKRNARGEADKLHAQLVPSIASMTGTLHHRSAGFSATVLGFKTDSASVQRLGSAVRLTSGDSSLALGKRGVLVPESLAQAAGIAVGDTCRFTYLGKFTKADTTVRLVVNGVFRLKQGTGSPAILLNEKEFYAIFYDWWPAPPASTGAFVPDSAHPLYSVLGPEWILLPRGKTTSDIQKTYREIAQKKWKAVTVDVQSMYEAGSAVLNLEYALNLITFVAVMVLFFIILIGVINTLRMTVRERTREIGTVRAIGMQKGDVRNVFLLETFFLALFAAGAGAVMAFAGMWVLSAITIDPQDNPMGMLLVNNHLSFVPTVAGTVGYIVLIVLIAVGTAYFPARRAANLSAADALRHYE